MRIWDYINAIRKQLEPYRRPDNQEAILIHPADEQHFEIDAARTVNGILVYTDLWMARGKVMMGTREQIEEVIRSLHPDQEEQEDDSTSN